MSYLDPGMAMLMAPYLILPQLLTAKEMPLLAQYAACSCHNAALYAPNHMRSCKLTTP